MRSSTLALLGGALLVGALALASLGWAVTAAQMQPLLGVGVPGLMLGARTGVGMAGIPRLDAGQHFIQEMIPHHEDAVAMAELALAQAEHPEVRQLAETIKRVQTDEIARMRAWYLTWYGTEVPPSTMASMPGMRPMTNMASLDGANPFDKVFIEQMIPHHQMAVMMASMALRGTEQPELRELEQSIITSQSAEIAQMRQWYAAWYGTPTP